jgi:uncharacterized protein YjbI with pentapeptide repeats
MSSTIQSHTQYTDQVFSGIRLEQTHIEAGEFCGCTFAHCSFVECVFGRCRFVDCTFERCDLSLAQVGGSVFSATRFVDSKVIGVNWAQADWSGTSLGQPIGFHKTAINHSTFIGLELRGIGITECIATNVDFREADLSEASFRGTDLSQSLFINTNLSQADLSEARNYDIAPGENEIAGARFSMPEALSLLYNLEIDLSESNSQ